MAAVGIRLVFTIGRILWRRHKRQERKERLMRLTGLFLQDMGRDMQDLAKMLRRGEAIKWTIKWKYDSRFGAAKAAMHAALEASLDALGDTAVRSAKRRAPRDTGELRESIGRTPVQHKGRGRMEVVIYSTAEHARYLEYGTVDTQASPMLRPAVRAARKRLPREVKKRMPQR